jgi:hypothetical protein
MRVAANTTRTKMVRLIVILFMGEAALSGEEEL